MIQPVPEALIETWRVYERHPSMKAAADEAAVSLATFKKRLRSLYDLLGVASSQEAGRVLRESGII